MIKREYHPKNTVLNTYGTLIYFFFQWLSTILIVRLSGYADAGIYSIAISTSNIYYCVASYGIRNYQVSDVVEEFTDRDYLLIRLITILISLILFLCSIPLLHYEHYVLLCLLMYLFFKYGETITDLLFGYFQKYDKYKQIAVSYTFKGILPLLFFCATLAFKHNLLMAIGSMLVVYFLIIVFYDYGVIKNHLDFKRSQFTGMILLKRCLPLMLYNLMVPVLNFIMRFFIKNHFGITLLGYFSSITMLLSILSVLVSSIFVTIIPQIAILYYEKKNKEILFIIRRILSILCCLLIIGLILGKFFGPFVFSIVFGKEIINYIYLLPLTIVSGVLLSMVSFLNSILISVRKILNVLIAVFMTVFIYLLLIDLLINLYSMNGALLALVISLLISLLYLVITNLFILENK